MKDPDQVQACLFQYAAWEARFTTMVSVTTRRAPSSVKPLRIRARDPSVA